MQLIKNERLSGGFLNSNTELAALSSRSFGQICEVRPMKHIKSAHFLVNSQLISCLRRTNVGVVTRSSHSPTEDVTEVQPTDRLVLRDKNLQSCLLFGPHCDQKLARVPAFVLFQLRMQHCEVGLARKLVADVIFLQQINI